MSDIVYKKVTSSEPMVAYLSDVISQKLFGGQKILWLIAGGSAIKVAVAVAQNLPKQYLENLTVTLTDERYGEVRHADSNWQQLMDAGFKLDGARLQPVLTGKSLSETTKDYAKMLKTDMEAADYSLALAGMGPDGHIFGIKAGSPSVASTQPVVDYKWDDYVRITPTGVLLKKLDEVVMYVAGQDKWPQLDTLEDRLDSNVQPAQLLKGLKRVIIFNDYKGEIS